MWDASLFVFLIGNLSNIKLNMTIAYIIGSHAWSLIKFEIEEKRLHIIGKCFVSSCILAYYFKTNTLLLLYITHVFHSDAKRYLKSYLIKWSYNNKL